MADRPVQARISYVDNFANERRRGRRDKLKDEHGRRANRVDGDATMTDSRLPQGTQQRPVGAGGKRPAHMERRVIRIENFGNASQSEVIEFLRRNCRKSVQIMSSTFDGSSLEIVVREQHAKVLTLLQGRSLNGNKLNIYLVHELSPAHRSLLQEYLRANFNEAAQVLSATNMSAVPQFNQVNLRPNLQNRTFALAFLKLIRTDFPLLQSLDLSSNNLSSLAQLATLHTHAPNLINLSLANNQIANISELEHLSEVKLRELQLANNPVASNPGMSALKRELSRKFPSLQLIDGEVIQSIQFAAIDVTTGDAVTALPDEQLMRFDSPITKNLAYELIRGYVSTYDSADRAQLGVIYAPNAVFSMTVVSGKTSIDNRSYTPLNRNLKVNKNARTDVADWDKRLKLIKIGREAVVAGLKSLPPTQHIPETFSVDAWEQSVPVPLLYVIFRGEFVDNPSKKNETKRSFDRTLVLQPAPPEAGVPAMIVNDMLSVREHSMKFRQAKHQILTKVVAETGATADVVARLLDAHDWNAAAVKTSMLSQPPPA